MSPPKKNRITDYIIKTLTEGWNKSNSKARTGRQLGVHQGYTNNISFTIKHGIAQDIKYTSFQGPILG